MPPDHGGHRQHVDRVEQGEEMARGHGLVPAGAPDEASDRRDGLTSSPGECRLRDGRRSAIGRSDRSRDPRQLPSWNAVTGRSGSTLPAVGSVGVMLEELLQDRRVDLDGLLLGRRRPGRCWAAARSGRRPADPPPQASAGRPPGRGRAGGLARLGPVGRRGWCVRCRSWRRLQERRLGPAEHERQREFLRDRPVVDPRGPSPAPRRIGKACPPASRAAGRLRAESCRGSPELQAPDDLLEGLPPARFRSAANASSGSAAFGLPAGPRLRAGRRTKAVHPGRQDLVGPIVRARENRSLLASMPVRPERAGEQLALRRVLRDRSGARSHPGSPAGRRVSAERWSFTGTSWNGPS